MSKRILDSKEAIRDEINEIKKEIMDCQKGFHQPDLYLISRRDTLEQVLKEYFGRELDRKGNFIIK